MRNLLFLMAILAGVAVAVSRMVSPERRESIMQMRADMTGRMMERMTRMMEEMPDDAPPKVFIAGFRRIQEQNEELLELTREQNTLLRERAAASQPPPAA